MNAYIDSLAIAARHALESDMPQDLLPLVICNEAAMLAGLESDAVGRAG